MAKRIDNNRKMVEKSTEIATIAELHLYLAVHTIVMAHLMYFVRRRGVFRHTQPVVVRISRISKSSNRGIYEDRVKIKFS
jgi:hypothetical protein